MGGEVGVVGRGVWCRERGGERGCSGERVWCGCTTIKGECTECIHVSDCVLPHNIIHNSLIFHITTHPTTHPTTPTSYLLPHKCQVHSGDVGEGKVGIEGKDTLQTTLHTKAVHAELKPAKPVESK